MPSWLRAITRRYPFNTPRASILNRLPAVPKTQGYIIGKSGQIFQGYYRESDDISRSLYWFGDHDPWVGYTLRKLAQPGDITLDIGANIGVTALELACAVGPQGRVICFEPMPHNLDHLRANVDANHTANIEVVPIALSNVEGRAQFMFNTTYPGRSTLGPLESLSPSGTVSVRTFDAWAQEKGFDRFGVAKIDVEDHEEKVFAGMAKTLAGQKIEAFLFERHLPPDIQSDPVLDLLERSGYDVFRIFKGYLRVIYVPAHRRHGGRPTSDFVAVLPGQRLDAIRDNVLNH
jgi:FkbM family methyltransferase